MRPLKLSRQHMRITFHSKVGSHLNKYNKEPLIRTWVLHPASSSVWGSCHRPQSLCCGTGTGTQTPEAQTAAIALPELWLSACCYLTAKSMRFIWCFSFPPNTICHSCSLAFQKLLLVFGQTFHSFSPLLATKAIWSQWRTPAARISKHICRFPMWLRQTALTGQMVILTPNWKVAPFLFNLFVKLKRLHYFLQNTFDFYIRESSNALLCSLKTGRVIA